MKPLIPTFEEARSLALHLVGDSSLSVLHRCAIANLVNFLERSAGPALEAEEVLGFEHCIKLASEEASDLQANAFERFHLEEWQIVALKQIYGGEGV